MKDSLDQSVSSSMTVIINLKIGYLNAHNSGWVQGAWSHIRIKVYSKYSFICK